MNPIIYTVEGNIGSGKSTFLKNLKCSDKIHILQEPVDEWFKMGS